MPSNVQKWCKQDRAFTFAVLACGECTDTSKHRAQLVLKGLNTSLDILARPVNGGKAGGQQLPNLADLIRPLNPSP